MSATRIRWGARRRPRLPLSLPRGLRVRLSRRRVLVAVLALAAALGGGWLWLRDSSLVAVQRVQIEGVRGMAAGEIRAALDSAARRMTTLDVNLAALQAAAASYPEVRSLSVRAQFPHGLVIRVRERRAVGELPEPGGAIAVADDGTLLGALGARARALPVIGLWYAPTRARLHAPEALAEVAALAAAPRRMLGAVVRVDWTGAHGIVVALRAGPSVYFGAPTTLHAKWGALEAVLADSRSAGASYIDVTVPLHPAAG